MQTPTVGRIVFYKARGSADSVFPKTDRAAIITDVRVDTSSDDSGVLMYQCRVCVFNPEGMFFSDWLPQGQNGGNWDWPKITN